MASGHTYKIAQGMTFKEFALECARSFLVECKEEGGSYLIPDEIPVPTYHLDSIRDVEDKLKLVNSMALPEATEKARLEYEKDKLENQRNIQERKDLEKKYRDMLAKVQKWTPPSEEHINIKKFMIEQIEQSIKWDCSTDYYYTQKNVKQLTGEAYIQKEREVALDKLEYHQKKYTKDVEMTNQRNRWVKLLKESLKEEV